MGANRRTLFGWPTPVLLLAFFLVPLSLTAHITFEKVYPRLGENGGFCVQQTSDGGYILVGITGAFEVLLVKTDSLGEIVWERTYGPGFGRTVLQLPDGGYAIGGDTGLGSLSYDAYILITDSLGNQLIKKTYGDSLVDEIRSVLGPTSDGGFILASSTDGDIYLVRLDSLGESLWSRVYPIPDTNDYAGSVQQTYDGGYIIGCDRVDPERQAYIVRTDSLGDLMWAKMYGFPGSDDYCYSAIQTADSGYAFAATSRHQLDGGWLIKTDSSGDSLWSRANDMLTEAYSLLQNPDGGYVISGWGGPEGGAHIVRTDSMGEVIWERSYASNISIGISVRRTSDGGYVMFGRYWDPAAGEYDWYLVKMDSGGMVDRDVEVVSLDLPPDTVFTDSTHGVKATVRSLLTGFAFFDVTATMDGYSDTVRVNGLGQDSLLEVTFKNWQVPPADSTTYTMTVCTFTRGDIDTTNDCMQKTIFAYNPVGVGEAVTRQSRVPGFWLTECLPNPFCASTTISYSLPVACHVTLHVHDVAGRLVDVLADEEQSAGIHHIWWDAKDRATGVYFCRMQAGGFESVREMLLVR